MRLNWLLLYLSPPTTDSLKISMSSLRKKSPAV